MKLRLGFVFALLLLGMAACQPAPQDGELPTLMVLPSLTPSSEAAATEAATTEPQAAPTLAETPTPVTPTGTPTARPTLSPTPTRDPTAAAGATLTAAVALTPRFATLTPAPGGGQSGGGVAADITITERQFEDALASQVADSETISSAAVDFVPDGLEVRLTALGGEALVTGDVILSVAPMGSAVRISIDDIRTNAPFAPDKYVDVVNGEFIVALVETLDALLAERVGSNNVERITMTDDTMEVFLIIG